MYVNHLLIYLVCSFMLARDLTYIDVITSDVSQDFE